jgi:hypothetical protein
VTLYKFLLTQPGRVIVFVNHVSSVRALCAMLQVLNGSASGRLADVHDSLAVLDSLLLFVDSLFFLSAA